MPEILLLPQMNLLQSNTFRTTIQKRSFNVIIAIYKQLYERVHDTDINYQNSDMVFNKTPEQVMDLLLNSGASGIHSSGN